MASIDFSACGIGYSHVQRNLPCQDAALSFSSNGFRAAFVSDGHGSGRHFRSDRGARFACDVAREAICEALDGAGLREALRAHADEWIGGIKARIVERWLERALEDAQRDPFSEREIETVAERAGDRYADEYRAGRRLHAAYGCTLVAGVVAPDCWFALQLGDGAVTVTSGDGYYHFPMPESEMNSGNLTASLCLPYPLDEFKHCYGLEPVTELFVCTDGIEKSFPPQSVDLADFFYSIACQYRADREQAQKALEQYLPRFSEKSAVQDDVSIAGVIDVEAPGCRPMPTRAQRDTAYRRLEAQREDVRQALAYQERFLEEQRAEIGRLEQESGALLAKIEQKKDMIKNSVLPTLEKKREELTRLDERIAQAGLERKTRPENAKVGAQEPSGERRGCGDELLWYGEEESLL